MIFFASALEALVLVSILITAGVACGLLLAWNRPVVLDIISEWWDRLGLG